jgi:hypothetical protein
MLKGFRFACFGILIAGVVDAIETFSYAIRPC